MVQLNTEKRKKGARRLLKILSVKDINQGRAVKKLTGKVTVQKENGQVVEKDRIYKQTSDAKNLVEELVESEDFPIEKSGGKIRRIDHDVCPDRLGGLA